MRSTASVNATLLLLSNVLVVSGNEFTAIKDSNLMANGEVGIELGNTDGLVVDGIIVDTPDGLPEGELLATVGTIDGPW